MTLSDALSRICPGNIQTAQAARQRFSDLAILPGSLGLLEDTVVRLAALQGSTQPLSSPKRTVIFCADNGVTAEGVTPSPSYMTAAQAVNFARGGGVINVFSRRAEAPVLVVDVGIAVPYWEPRIRAAFVRKGTDNIVRGPAMTREECLHTLETGISLAAEAAADGIRVAIPGEMGIGNTTTTGAVASVLLGIPPEELVPHGSAGEAGAAHKAEVIRRALAVNRPDPSDPLGYPSQGGRTGPGRSVRLFPGLCSPSDSRHGGRCDFRCGCSVRCPDGACRPCLSLSLPPSGGKGRRLAAGGVGAVPAAGCRAVFGRGHRRGFWGHSCWTMPSPPITKPPHCANWKGWCYMDKHPGHSLLIALSMYSILPMPRVDWREDNMRWSLACLPVVGGLAGLLLGGWCWLAVSRSMAPLLFAAGAVLLPLLLSGGFHMDGFLDAADGIFSRRDRETSLQIMKDPHCGPFAVLCGGALLLVNAGSWSQLLSCSALLPAACLTPLAARSLTVMAGSRLPYASTSTLGALFADRAAKGVKKAGVAEAALSLLLLPAAGLLAGGFPALCAAAMAVAAALLLVRLFSPPDAAAFRRCHR